MVDSVTLYGIFLLLANMGFMALYFWIYSKRNKEKFIQAGKIPFANDEKNSHE